MSPTADVCNVHPLASDVGGDLAMLVLLHLASPVRTSGECDDTPDSSFAWRGFRSSRGIPSSSASRTRLSCTTPTLAAFQSSTGEGDRLERTRGCASFPSIRLRPLGRGFRACQLHRKSRPRGSCLPDRGPPVRLARSTDGYVNRRYEDL
jgi:hypothetical protein